MYANRVHDDLADFRKQAEEAGFSIFQCGMQANTNLAFVDIHRPLDGGLTLEVHWKAVPASAYPEAAPASHADFPTAHFVRKGVTGAGLRVPLEEVPGYVRWKAMELVWAISSKLADAMRDYDAKYECLMREQRAWMESRKASAPVDEPIVKDDRDHEDFEEHDDPMGLDNAFQYGGRDEDNTDWL